MNLHSLMQHPAVLELLREVPGSRVVILAAHGDGSFDVRLWPYADDEASTVLTVPTDFRPCNKALH